MDFTSIIELIVSAIFGGGLVAVLTAPEKKKAAKLENNTKIIEDCYKHIGRLEDELKNLKEYYEGLIKQRDEEIERLQTRCDELQKQLDSIIAKRDNRGRFQKRNTTDEKNK